MSKKLKNESEIQNKKSSEKPNIEPQNTNNVQIIRKHIVASIILNIALIISTILGIIFDVFTALGPVCFLYFTVISNILIMIISIVFLIYQIKYLKNNEYKVPSWLFPLKFIFTVAITVTFIIYTFILAPVILAYDNFVKVFSVNNFCLHIITPIIAIINFCLIDSHFCFKKHIKYLGLILPICYFIFSLLLASISNKAYFIDANNTYSQFPYFFLNYHKFGWFTLNKGIEHIGVFYWLVFVALLILGIGFILLKLQNHNHKKYYSNSTQKK